MITNYLTLLTNCSSIAHQLLTMEIFNDSRRREIYEYIETTGGGMLYNPIVKDYYCDKDVTLKQRIIEEIDDSDDERTIDSLTDDVSVIQIMEMPSLKGNDRWENMTTMEYIEERGVTNRLNLNILLPRTWSSVQRMRRQLMLPYETTW